MVEIWYQFENCANPDPWSVLKSSSLLRYLTLLSSCMMIQDLQLQDQNMMTFYSYATSLQYYTIYHKFYKNLRHVPKKVREQIKTCDNNIKIYVDDDDNNDVVEEIKRVEKNARKAK